MGDDRGLLLLEGRPAEQCRAGSKKQHAEAEPK
jgi:hypothetical protein